MTALPCRASRAGLKRKVALTCRAGQGRAKKKSRPDLQGRAGQGVRASGQPCPVTVSDMYMFSHLLTIVIVHSTENYLCNSNINHCITYSNSNILLLSLNYYWYTINYTT
jgi:hypothetical protein